MGVKLLHSDARRLRVELIESCNQLEELWAKAERPPPDKILAAWTIQRKLREKIIKSRSDREEMEAFLRNREVWDNMDQRPVHLKAAHSKDDWRDDWNGAKFLGLSVKGKLFLYQERAF